MSKKQDTPKISLDIDPERFLLKIMEAYPDDHVTLKKVISLGKIAFSGSRSMTAAVVNTRPYTLIFGKPFVEENIQTVEDCVYLLSHELTHLILGHFAVDILELFKEKKLRQFATHIIVDCQVNATCFHSLKEEKYFEFIKRYYSKTEMPTCFFRPDGEPPSDDLKKLHEKLYSVDGISNEELIDGLMPWFKENEDKLRDVVQQLLGNHSDIFEDRSSSESESEGDLPSVVTSYAGDLQDILDEELERAGKKENTEEDKKDGQQSGADKPQPGGRKAGTGRDLIQKQIEKAKTNINYKSELSKKLKKTYISSPSSKLTAALDGFFPKKPKKTPIPNFYDRRTVALYSAGELPVFHDNIEKGRKVMVPCYIDVSGSQEHVIPKVRDAVVRRKKEIGNKVFCFSNVISETTIDCLRNGKYHTTGGTDFNPIAKHILKNKFRKAIILTDGEAGLSADLIEILKRKNIKIKVGWTVPNPSKAPLKEVLCEEFYLFSADRNGI